MKQLIEKTEKYVTDALMNKLDNAHLYHNLKHTASVVESAQEILVHSNFDDKLSNLITIAAWFHDVGYIRGYDGHEEHSCAIASEFLLGEGLEKKGY